MGDQPVNHRARQADFYFQLGHTEKALLFHLTSLSIFLSHTKTGGCSRRSRAHTIRAHEASTNNRSQLQRSPLQVLVAASTFCRALRALFPVRIRDPQDSVFSKHLAPEVFAEGSLIFQVVASVPTRTPNGGRASSLYMLGGFSTELWIRWETTKSLMRTCEKKLGWSENDQPKLRTSSAVWRR